MRRAEGLQAIHDNGLNPWACKLLQESFLRSSDVTPITCVLGSIEIEVRVRHDLPAVNVTIVNAVREREETHDNKNLVNDKSRACNDGGVEE